MADLEKEVKKEEKKIGKFFSKKENIWMTVSIVLLIILIGFIAWPHGISKSTAGQKIINFAQAQGVNATLLSVENKGSLYQVNLSIQGQELPVYITKDGKYFTQGIIDLSPSKTSSNPSTSPTQTQSVPKTDKPVLDLYVFSYCPYGTQTEKGLIPVYNLLKSKADINIVYIGAMHGEFEHQESLRQLCIQKIYGKDKLFSYINKFDTNASVGNCGGQDSCVLPIINNIYSSLGISQTSVNSCMTKDAEAMYTADEQQAQSNGVSGSPTFIVNGVQTNSGRDPASILKTVCSAFNTAPSECSQVLSSASPGPGFGGTTGSSSGASCG